MIIVRVVSSTFARLSNMKRKEYLQIWKGWNRRKRSDTVSRVFAVLKKKKPNISCFFDRYSPLKPKKVLGIVFVVVVSIKWNYCYVLYFRHHESFLPPASDSVDPESTNQNVKNQLCIQRGRSLKKLSVVRQNSPTIYESGSPLFHVYWLTNQFSSVNIKRVVNGFKVI